MVAIGTLLLAVLITILGSQGFRKSGFLITRKLALHGRSAYGAGTVLLLLSVPLWYFGTQQLVALGRAVDEYFDQVAQEQKEEQEIIRSNTRQRILVQGCEFFREKDYQNAIKTFGDCLGGDEKGPALLMRARCYYALGDFKLALQQLDEAVQDNWQDPDLASRIYLHRGYAHYRLSQFQAALDDFSDAIRATPERFYGQTARGFRGWIYATCPDEKFRNQELAAADAEQMPRFVRGTDWTELEQLAAILASLEQWEEAVDLQSDVVGHVPYTPRMKSSETEHIIKVQTERLRMYQQKTPYRETQPLLELRLRDEVFYY